MTTPNQYHLSGRAITVDYYTDGHGPITGVEGLVFFVYQDSHLSKTFGQGEVRVVDVGDLGQVVSVTLAPTVDTGSTTFSLLIPSVELSDGTGTVPITTEGITAIHRILAAAIGHPQHDTYTVTRLSGTAAFGENPL